MKKRKRPALHKCHDCGVVEGELHVRGCDMERCPFCGGQLITCACCYAHFYPTFDRTLGLRPRGTGPTPKFCGLPEKVYRYGLPEAQQEEWERLLAEKGRVPWIQYPNICCRCGKLWPDFFRVSDAEWQRYVEPAMQQEMLCRECYDWIVQVIDAAAGRKP